MIEFVAEAIADSASAGNGYKQIAIAAIKAMREPTDDMVEAGDKHAVYWDVRTDSTQGECEPIYTAMIDAALGEHP